MRPTVVCFSGKRKSGKDFVCTLLAKQLESEGLQVAVRGVSYPLKEEYAKLFSLDPQLLKSDAPYKEIHRRKMVEWGESIRRDDPSYFCRATISNIGSVDVVLISDCRRPSDIEFFRNRFGDSLRLVRVESDTEVRKARGWQFTAEIDDAETECALDEFGSWHFVINNSAHCTPDAVPTVLSEQIGRIAQEIQQIVLD